MRRHEIAVMGLQSEEGDIARRFFALRLYPIYYFVDGRKFICTGMITKPYGLSSLQVLKAAALEWYAIESVRICFSASPCTLRE